MWLTLGVVVVLLMAAIAFRVMRAPRRHPPGQVPMEPIDAESLQADVKALAKIDIGSLRELLTADDAVSSFAARATSGKGSAADKARAIVAALAQRKDKQAFVDWSLFEPRAGSPLTAAETWRALQRDGARAQLYPLELAALAVAALRSVDVPALLAEVYQYPNEKKPLDPSGRFGYFGAYVPEGQGKRAVFDAYGGRTVAPAAADFVVLNDAQAVGAALAIRAVDELRNRIDVQHAHADADAAIALLPKSPTTHGARAEILLGEKAHVGEGEKELATALALRDDAVRHAQIAVHKLALQDPISAQREIVPLFKDQPDFALAHALRATALMMFDEFGAARPELETAERLDPQLPLVPQLWAQLLAAEGNLDAALVKAQEAVKQRPNDPQPLYILLRIEKRLNRDADMRRHAHRLIELSPEPERESRRTMLKRALGDDVFEARPDAGAAVKDAAAPAQ
jgi:tetratricopeptide (TPR) repeat protein